MGEQLLQEFVMRGFLLGLVVSLAVKGGGYLLYRNYSSCVELDSAMGEKYADVTVLSASRAVRSYDLVVQNKQGERFAVCYVHSHLPIKEGSYGSIRFRHFMVGDTFKLFVDNEFPNAD